MQHINEVNQRSGINSFLLSKKKSPRVTSALKKLVKMHWKCQKKCQMLKQENERFEIVNQTRKKKN